MNACSNQQIGTAPRTMKLSPNSVVAASGFEASQNHLALNKLSHSNQGELNVPPIHTPHTQKSVRKTISPSVPELPPRVPPLPPKSPIAGRRPRSVSESEASMKNNRRNIFGQYWSSKERGYNNGGAGTATLNNGSLRRRTQLIPPCAHERSSSLSILESASVLPEPVDYRMYAPPVDYRSAICSRFAPVDAVPALEQLPPLPTPLRRLCPEGDGTGGLCGMYPLVTPVPILKQSSYRSLHCGLSDKSMGSERMQSSLSDMDSFNLTKSVRFSPKDLSFETRSSSSMSNSDQSRKARGVQFDPRITVTEFEDSIERTWYDDFELMRLKHETVLLAQEYLMTHQHEAEKYNRAKLDPITGTYRKRALFSLPVLASTVEESSVLNPDCGEFSDIIDKQVKTILVVDPNPAIQQLFRKSLKSMFPEAEIHTAQSGQEALKLASAQLHREYGSNAFQHRNFDIIVIEQRLCQSLHDPRPSDLAKTKPSGNTSCLSMASMGNMSHNPRRLQKPSSFAGVGGDHNHGSVNMCGSDLIKAIQTLEADVFASARSHLYNSTHSQPIVASPSNETGILISTKLFQWRSLLIGVSMQPDRDAGLLTQAGADVIWGKPIPHVGDALRNQLVQSLMNKRRRHTVGSD